MFLIVFESSLDSFHNGLECRFSGSVRGWPLISRHVLEVLRQFNRWSCVGRWRMQADMILAAERLDGLFNADFDASLRLLVWFVRQGKFRTFCQEIEEWL